MSTLDTSYSENTEKYKPKKKQNWFKRLLSKFNVKYAYSYYRDDSMSTMVMTAILSIGLVFSILLASVAFIGMGLSDEGWRTLIVLNLFWMVPTIIANNDKFKKDE